MKRSLLVAFGLALAIVFSHGQGTVLFQNITPVNAPIYDEAQGGIGAGTAGRLVGTNFRAQLWAGPAGGQLEAVGASVPFLTGSSGAGFFIGGSRVIDTVAPGGLAAIQVRVWQVDCGIIANTWEEAVARGRALGTSPILTLATGGAGDPPTPPVQLLGLQVFSGFYSCVPEPSTIALAVGGGLAALMLVRRRK